LCEESKKERIFGFEEESMQRQLKRIVESLRAGDLVVVEWCDASIGKSLGSGVTVDVPVKSWGIFLSVLGDKIKHIVLAQNAFHYSNGLFDVDYTSIPLAWTVNVGVVAKGHLPEKTADELVSSFILGGRKRFETRAYHHHYYQKRVKNHA
jgi:hypothetical protein